METLALKSDLSQEEIDNNFEKFDLFEEIMTALKEALENERSKHL